MTIQEEPGISAALDAKQAGELAAALRAAPGQLR